MSEVIIVNPVIRHSFVCHWRPGVCCYGHGRDAGGAGCCPSLQDCLFCHHWLPGIDLQFPFSWVQHDFNTYIIVSDTPVLQKKDLSSIRLHISFIQVILLLHFINYRHIVIWKSLCYFFFQYPYFDVTYIGKHKSGPLMAVNNHVLPDGI